MYQQILKKEMHKFIRKMNKRIIKDDGNKNRLDISSSFI